MKLIQCIFFISGCVLAGFICDLSLPSLRAEENKTPPERIALLARQLTSLDDTFLAQKSLSLVMSQTIHIERGFDHDEVPDYRGVFKLFYAGSRFLYDIEISGVKGATYSKVESFDGEHFDFFDRTSGMLVISSKPFLKDIVMCEGHMFFMPFIFLQSGFKANPFAQLSYEQLTSKKDWANAMPAISAIKDIVLENEQYLEVDDIGSNVDGVSKRSCVFDVYFAKRFNWYPMKWTRRVPAGEVVSDYSVEQLGYLKMENGTQLPYPKVSILRHYQNGKLRDTQRFEITQINFGTVTDDDISIDPASARRIRDIDKGVTIKVPK